MSNTYDITITSLACSPSQDSLTDVVIIVYWMVTAKDPTNTYVSSVSGSTTVQPPDPSAFVPFDSLTKDVVVSWLPDLIGGYAPALDDAVAKQAMTATTSLLAPPWVTA